MHYRDFRAFEDAVFGRSLGGNLSNSYKSFRSFDDSARAVIENFRKGSIPACPKTRLARLIYSSVLSQIGKSGIDGRLVLLSSRGTELDIHHESDGLFLLITKIGGEKEKVYLATIDLYNLDSNVCEILKSRWIDESRDVYSPKKFQSDLYSQKNGLAVLLKGGHKITEWNKIFHPVDLRGLGEISRPENHFVLTPYYTESWKRRKEFSKLIADYFIREAGNSNGSTEPQTPR